MTEEIKTEDVSRETNEYDTITNEDVVETDAGIRKPEDTLVAYEALFEKQKQELDNQIKLNNNLQKQINILMRNGASVTETKETINEDVSRETNEINEINEDYVSLSEIGKEIGKRDYANHNLKEK